MALLEMNQTDERGEVMHGVALNSLDDPLHPI